MSCRRRLMMHILVAALLLAPPRAMAGERPPATDAEGANAESPSASSTGLDEALETRIRELRDQRQQIRLGAPVAGVVVGGLLLEYGLQTLIEVQFRCPGFLAWDWNCSHDTRRAITIGSASAFAVGAVVMAVSVPILSRRLRARRVLSEEINRVRAVGVAATSTARPAGTRWHVGFDLLGERKAVLAVVRF